MALVKRLFETGKGVKQYGYIWMPDGNTAKLPVIFFCHGRGTNGTTSASADKLLGQGPLQHVKAGWKPNYIIIATQWGYDWSVSADAVKYVLDNDPDVKKYGNGQFMVTGLSAGGTTVVECMKRFNAPGWSFVPMSPAADAVNNYPAGVYRVWAFCGTLDTLTPASTVIDMRKIGAKVTLYPDTHKGWAGKYDPNFKQDGQNVYEYSFDPNQPVTGYTTPPVVLPPVIIEPLPPVNEIKEDTLTLTSDKGQKVVLKVAKVNGQWVLVV